MIPLHSISNFSREDASSFLYKIQRSNASDYRNRLKRSIIDESKAFTPQPLKNQQPNAWGLESTQAPTTVKTSNGVEYKIITSPDPS